MLFRLSKLDAWRSLILYSTEIGQTALFVHHLFLLLQLNWHKFSWSRIRNVEEPFCVKTIESTCTTLAVGTLLGSPVCWKPFLCARAFTFFMQRWGSSAGSAFNFWHYTILTAFNILMKIFLHFIFIFTPYSCSSLH